jgi:two-component system sensor histidine kinase UhpB
MPTAANAAIDRRLPWFRLIAETAADYIAVLDAQGRRQYVNPALENLLGAERVRAGGLASENVHAEDRERLQALFRQSIEDGVGRLVEFRMILPNGDIRHIESQASMIRGVKGRVTHVVVVSRDVTERRRMEDALRAREVQLQEAQAVGNLGSWELDVRNGRVWWSDQLRRIFGVDERHVPTLENHIESVHPEDRATLLAATQVAVASGQVYDKPYRIVRPDGSVRLLFNSGRMERDEEGRPVRMLGVCMDITDKTWIESQARIAAERLRSVSRRLVEVQEAERRVLARELHDRVGQTLTALGLNLRVIAAQMSPPSRDAAATQLEDCMRLVEDTVAAMRGVMGELRPQALDDYGLLAALRTHVAAFTARTGIHVSLGGEDRQGRVSKEVELALFRIAQEALNNVAKHSKATAVQVSFRGSAQAAVLELADDGGGFDAGRSAPGDAAGWGLVIMRERAESIGAHFNLETAPGRGVRITVRYER